MVIILLVFGFLIIGVAIMLITEDESEVMLYTGFFICVAGGIGTLVVIGCLIIHPIEVKADIQAFNSVRETVSIARENPEISQFELAALQHKIIEKNQWLRRSKYWAKHSLTNWFYPRDIFKVQPIK